MVSVSAMSLKQNGGEKIGGNWNRTHNILTMSLSFAPKALKENIFESLSNFGLTFDLALGFDNGILIWAFPRPFISFLFSFLCARVNYN